jgi:hypothetical protein
MADIASLNRALRATLLLDTLYREGVEEEVLEEDTPEGELALVVRRQLAGHAAALRSAGASTSPPQEVDLTGGAGSGAGPFFTLESPDDLLRTAQLLHDLLVRIHLHAFAAQGADAALRARLAEVLATAASHAARVRELRATLSFVDVKPWVTDVYPGFDFEDEEPEDGPLSQFEIAERVYGREPVASTATTTGEDNRTHAGIAIPEGDRSTEAFDEPIAPATADTVLALFLP